jgi:uncharacterized protein YjbJ (UPF0337 family)
MDIQPIEEEMMAENSGPQEGVKGVVEGVKGKAKEAVGTVTGRSDLTEEGQAQQDKADAQRDAARKEAGRSRLAAARRLPRSARSKASRVSPHGPGSQYVSRARRNRLR